MYPAQMIKHNFPCGLPEIQIYDKTAIPCSCLRKDGRWCGDETCPYEANLNIVMDVAPPTAQDIMNMGDQVGGFIELDIVCPSNLFHPVLPLFDEENKKLTFPCGLLPRQVFAIQEVQVALRVGYTIQKVYRFDRYKLAPGLWKVAQSRLYLGKMMYSRETPSEEEQDRLSTAYAPMGLDDLMFENWEKNKSKKQTFKTMNNSTWGKQAQNMDTSERVFFNPSKPEEFDAIMDNMACCRIDARFDNFGNTTMATYKRANDAKSRLTLKDSFLPAGVYVPMYGRLALYEQLQRLGPAVLYYDTDSVLYIHDPDLYTVPESDILGGWERDDKDKGITQFVALAPKSYAIRNTDPADDTVKLKGVTINADAARLICFDNFKSVVMEWKDQFTRSSFSVRQTNWTYKLGQGVQSFDTVKVVKFDESILKGNLDRETMILYPPGYL